MKFIDDVFINGNLQVFKTLTAEQVPVNKKHVIRKLELDNLDNKLNENVQEINTNITNLKNEINNNINTAIQDIKNEINNNINVAIQDIRNEINNNINVAIDDIRKEIVAIKTDITGSLTPDIEEIKVTLKNHKHTKSQITDFPSFLPNPYSLFISLNGASQGAYSGNADKSININYSNVGAAAASHTHSYLPLAGGTITGNLTVNGAYTQTGTVGRLVAIQSGGPRGDMLWAW